MKKFLLLLVALFAFYQYIFYIPSSLNPTHTDTTPSSVVDHNEIQKSPSTVAQSDQQHKVQTTSAVTKAYKNQQNHIWVEGHGKVIRVLRDDTKGSRHQKFILQIPGGQTLLVAHNIDLASRLSGLSTGDSVAFRGEYIWNNKGGLIHWTHRDPGGRRKGGWLKYKGRIYH